VEPVGQLKRTGVLVVLAAAAGFIILEAQELQAKATAAAIQQVILRIGTPLVAVVALGQADLMPPPLVVPLPAVTEAPALLIQ
jgi:hypothetical protein